jgi:hypothetical protein
MARRISALAYFDDGSQGFEENYDSNITVEQYVAHFEAETKRMNVTSKAIVYYIKVTINNEDGSLKLDEKGDRLYEILYVNDKINYFI